MVLKEGVEEGVEEEVEEGVEGLRRFELLVAEVCADGGVVRANGSCVALERRDAVGLF